METPTNNTETPQESKQKRSPLLIIILILLLLLMGCCIIGVVFCRGTSRLPDILDRLSEYVSDPNSEFGDLWKLIEDNGYFPDGNDSGADATITPTVPVYGSETDSSICEGISGNFEMQILVGPADVVGLEPFSIGTIPFTVDFDQGMYLVQGEGTIDYEDVLVQEWGTYTVFFDMYGKINGVCTQVDDGGVLDITLDLEGEQEFVVDSPIFHEEYPWEGEHSFPFSFPVEDGSTKSGEGWAFILHLD